MVLVPPAYVWDTRGRSFAVQVSVFARGAQAVLWSGEMLGQHLALRAAPRTLSLFLQSGCVGCSGPRLASPAPLQQESRGQRTIVTTLVTLLVLLLAGNSSGWLQGTHPLCPVINPWVVKLTRDVAVSRSPFHKGRISCREQGLVSASRLSPPPLSLGRGPVPCPAVWLPRGGRGRPTSRHGFCQ